MDRIQRHAYIDDLIYKALIRATVPAVKEPQGLVRVDGKRPDGLTLVPWQSGRCATWDITVIDTLAASYVLQSAVNAASTAYIAASRKEAKYSNLCHSYRFFPAAIETLGPLSASSQIFISEIGDALLNERQILARRLSCYSASRSRFNVSTQCAW
jgi:hypothetical protein